MDNRNTVKGLYALSLFGPSSLLPAFRPNLFFVLGIEILYRAFKILDNRYPHTRRIPIISLALCFFFAYAAEKYFGPTPIFTLSMVRNLHSFAIRPQPTIFPIRATATKHKENSRISPLKLSILVLIPMLAKKIGPKII